VRAATNLLPLRSVFNVILYGFLMSRLVSMPGTALETSTVGMVHSYWSRLVRASSSFSASEVRPQLVQNHSRVLGFHLRSLCFIWLGRLVNALKMSTSRTKMYAQP